MLLDLSIDADSLELIETESRRIEERRADLVARVRGGDDGLEFILHIEIQNNNHPKMPWRMLRYLGDIALQHPGLPVRQYLIYIGRERLTMPAGIDLERLRQITGEDTKAFREYLDMLEILSDNRNLKAYIKEAEAMLTQVDVERLPSYELGMERGMEKGMERGMERGMEKGEARMLLRLLRLKFGDLPPVLERRIDEADGAALLRWSERVLTAARLEDVLSQ